MTGLNAFLRDLRRLFRQLITVSFGWSLDQRARDEFVADILNAPTSPLRLGNDVLTSECRRRVRQAQAVLRDLRQSLRRKRHDLQRDESRCFRYANRWATTSVPSC